jgi:hypothetical protein
MEKVTQVWLLYGNLVIIDIGAHGTPEHASIQNRAGKEIFVLVVLTL